MRFLVVLSLFLFSAVNVCHGQKNELGRPYIQSYLMGEYGASQQNWSIKQNRNGLIYTANNDGILEYDGESWDLIKASSLSFLKAVEVSPHSEKLYTGGLGSIGFFEPDQQGEYQYHSLRDSIPEPYQNFKSVDRIIRFERDIYYQSEEFILQMSRDSTAIWSVRRIVGDQAYLNTSTLQLTHCFHWSGNLYVSLSDGSIWQFKFDSWEPIYLGNEDLQDLSFTLSVGQGLILGDYHNGLYAFDGQTIAPFHTEAGDYLKEHKLMDGVMLPNRRLVLATESRGMVVIDQQGNWKQVINESTGLHNNRLVDITVDEAGSVWAACNLGIARVDLGLPLTFFDESVSDIGDVLDAVRLDGTLYVGSFTGLYRLDHSMVEVQGKNRQKSIFTAIGSVSTEYWDLLNWKNQLIVATADGIYRYLPNGDKLEKIAPYNSNLIKRSEVAKDRVYITSEGGIAVLRYSSDQDNWQDLGYIEGTKTNFYSMTEDSQGRLWIGSPGQGVMEVAIGTIPKAQVTRYDTSDGLPESSLYYTTKFDDDVIVSTVDGVYRFDVKRQQFYKSNQLTKGGDGRFLDDVAEDSKGRIWSFAVREDDPPSIAGFKVEPQTKNITAFPNSLSGVTQTLGDFIYPDQDEIVWIGTTEALIRYDSSMDPLVSNERMGSPVIIRQIMSLQEDSVLVNFRGSHLDGINIPFQQNSIRLTYAAPAFSATDVTEYQFRLDGENWSIWTSEHHKDYTNLAPGTYQFEVQARSKAGLIGPIASASFSVLPPWYRTWWAYSLYILAGMGLLGFTGNFWVQWRMDQQLKEMRAQQAEELKKLDIIKSQFFANISHELRTPLMLMRGPIKKLLETNGEIPDGWQKDLERLDRNGERLQGLVEKILDLTKLEAGTMKLVIQPLDLSVLVKRLVESFRSLAENQEITLEWSSDLDEAHIYGDVEKLNTIFINLLSNALKFTKKGGNVSVSLKSGDDNTFKVIVRDTGIGMSSEQLDHIFDRYYSLGNDYGEYREGIGIGLALTHELIQLHGAKISVESTPNVGSTFSVSFKPGKTHFKKDNILSEVESAEIGEIPASSVSAPITGTGNDTNKENLADSNKFTVLVVDDNADLREYITEMLIEDYNVVTAINGRDALQKIPDVNPDLIVTDVMMPEMDGFTFAQKLKANKEFRYLPVIFVTAKATEEDRLHGLSIGVDDYIIKPFNPQELKIRINNLIANKLERQVWQDHASEEKEETLSADQELLNSIAVTVKKNMSNSDYTVEQLSHEVQLSSRQLYRKLKQLTGFTPAAYMRELRLQEARKLLEQHSHQTVSEIMYIVGFNHISYFSNLYEERFGRRPAEYFD